VRRGRGHLHAGAYEGDRRVEPAEQGRAATEQDRDHVHADLIDQAERECLLHDGGAVQADDLVARDVLGLLDRADHAVGDEREHGWVRRGRLVVGDHEARDVTDGVAVAPTTVMASGTPASAAARYVPLRRRPRLGRLVVLGPPS
jgi:hypothetical protein